jgi:Bifunctional DNA primase/polymerase, N-terminal
MSYVANSGVSDNNAIDAGAQNFQDAPPVAPGDAPIQVLPAAITEFRLAMWRGGYLPLPCKGKIPEGKDWQKRTDTTEQEVRLWDRVWPYSLNTGCLTRNTPTLDVDVTDRDACRAVFEHIKVRFEGRGVILCRSGNVPKFAVPFRTGTPFKKFATKVVPHGGGKPAQFEFLGDGQQFVVDGIHPDTRQPYRWWPADRNPATVPREALPHIDEAGARALVEDLAALLVRDFGFARPEEPKVRAVYVPRSDGTRRSPRAVRASVDGLIRVVMEGTPDLDRNRRLFWATCRVRDMSAAGEFTGEEVQDALDALGEAALRVGLMSFEINRTISSGMGPR